MILSKLSTENQRKTKVTQNRIKLTSGEKPSEYKTFKT
jgi:hypothetical protein